MVDGSRNEKDSGPQEESGPGRRTTSLVQLSSGGSSIGWGVRRPFDSEQRTNCPGAAGCWGPAATGPISP
jgi:hypothetical protein